MQTQPSKHPSQGEHPGIAIKKQFAEMSIEQLKLLDPLNVVRLSPYLTQDDVGFEKWTYIRGLVMLYAYSTIAQNL